MSEACVVDNCKRPYRAKGYCTVHYKEWRHGKFPHARWKNVPPPSKAEAKSEVPKEEVKEAVAEAPKKEEKKEAPKKHAEPAS